MRGTALGAGPDVVVACVGGGSNAAGTFAGFVTTPARLIGVEAAGGAAVTDGRPGVLHGSLSSFLQDEDGQIAEARSVSAGLDYPGVGPEHACLAAVRAPSTTPRPMRRPWPRPSCVPGPRASCPRSSRLTPWPGCAAPRARET